MQRLESLDADRQWPAHFRSLDGERCCRGGCFGRGDRRSRCVLNLQTKTRYPARSRAGRSPGEMETIVAIASWALSGARRGARSPERAHRKRDDLDGNSENGVGSGGKTVTLHNART